MFCEKCGAENVNNAKFCKSCGNMMAPSQVGGGQPGMQPQSAAPQGTGQQGQGDAPQGAAQRMTPPPVQANRNMAPAGNNNKNMGKIIIGCVAAVIVLMIAGRFIKSMGNTINLNKYLVIEANGYEGYGTATAKVDWDAVEKKYGSKLKLKKTGKSTMFGDISDWYTPVGVLQDAVSISLDERENLSNGTEVSYTWNVDENYKSLVNCKLKCKDGKEKIEGLTEVASFDAFADLEVSFSGIGPNGSINMVYTGSDLNSYDFSCDKGSGLSNGDTVTITIPENKILQCAENIGKIPATLEKEYKVEGLSSYMTKISELNSEDLTAMQQQAEDHYMATVAQKWEETEKLDSFTYLGCYLLTKKSEAIWGSQNILTLVYKVQTSQNFSNDNGSYKGNTDIYWYIQYENLIVKSDGRLDFDVTKYNIPSEKVSIDSGVSNGWFSTYIWSHYGYAKLADLYKSVVTSKIGDYNHEDNVDESLAPAAAPRQEEPAEEAAEEDSAEAGADGYILPDSDKKLLTEKDLEGLSEEQLKLARNEIYARHGRKFKDKEIQKHFNDCEWYEGTIKAKDFDEGTLSEIEVKNRDFIVKYEEEHGYNQ